MNEFKDYVNKLLKKTNLEYSEREELKKELIEHLNSSKDDHMNNGLSEKEAISKSIENFKKSDFLSEVNDFTTNKKLYGFNLLYFIKMNLTLIITYMLMLVSSIALTENTVNSNLIYFLIITFVLFINYECACMNFEKKEDIIKNIIIISFSFFLVEKTGVSVIAFIYRSISNNLEMNILDLYVFNISKLFIYLGISILTILLAKYIKRDVKNNIKFSIIDIIVLFLSILLNIIYFLFPNRFYLLNLAISKVLNINIESFNKNFSIYNY
ncbi:permease prefix domain 1-containing protein [Clostridium sp. Marseille-QA1073]